MVDDDESVRGVLELARSRMAGGEVKSCASGEEALALLKAQTFDAVPPDLRMPGFSGQGTFERMSPRLRKRVVFITGDAMRTNTPEFLRHTGQPAVGERASQVTLVSAIERVIELH